MFPDNNGNGIPDAFENRKPISEILNSEEIAPENADSTGSDLLRVSAGVSQSAVSGNRFFRRLIGDTAFSGSADYGKYRIHIPTEGNAVMLEIKNGDSFVACVFQNRQRDARLYLPVSKNAGRGLWHAN